MSVLDYKPASLEQRAARRPIVELLLLAGPTIAQMLSYNLMQFIDTWLLSHLGAKEPTAVGNSGILAFSCISLGFGAMFVVNTLVSQSYGQKNYAACGRYLWQGLWFSAAYALLLLPVVPLARGLFVRAGHEPALVPMETVYLQIVVGAAVLKLAGTAVGQFLLAVNQPVLVFVSTVAGVSVNAICAYALIFGRFGAPAMGVVGAAWAQNVGVAVELGVLLVFATQGAVRRTYNLRAWQPRLREFWTLLRVGVPAGVQVTADVLAWTLFLVLVMARFGTPAMAANSFMMRYMSLSFMPAFGLSTAVTALVGRYIGMGRPDVAAQRTRLGFMVTAAYMLSCGLAFYLGRNVLIGVFTSDPEIKRIGATLLTFAAVYQFFDAMYIIYNGGLRGAGDTFVPAVATAGLCWGITVCGGYLVARRWPGFGPGGPWVVATGYGIVLGFFMYLRFRAGGWKRIRLGEGERVSG